MYIPRQKRFRFENVWLREKDYWSVVKNSWESMEGKEIIEKIGMCCIKLEEWGGGINAEHKKQIMDCRHKMRNLRSRRDVIGIQMYNK